MTSITSHVIEVRCADNLIKTSSKVCVGQCGSVAKNIRVNPACPVKFEDYLTGVNPV